MAYTTRELINYILNGRADKGAALWKTYQDAASALPVDGIGGTPTVTFGVSQTTPLSGVSDFNFTKPAANVQGQGVSIPFDIESADLAKVLSISFDYEVVSGTYADGDLAVYVVQDPSGTPVAIQPAGFRVLNLASGNRGKVIATFQTHASLKNYRLCFHVASTSTAAYVLAVDNVSVGPQVVQYGSPITDPVDYIPTYTGFGTVTQTNMGLRWWRSGANLHIQGDFTIGAVAAATASFSLPAGLTSNLAAVSGNFQIVGKATNNSVVVPQAKDYNLIMTNGGSTVNFSICEIGNGTNPLAPQNGNAIFPSGTVVSVNMVVQITGWSSTVQMSNDTDTRVVAASYAAPTNAFIVPANVETVVICSQKITDTHSGYNATTGKYTVQVPGVYVITGTVNFGDAGGVVTRLLRVYKNTTIIDYASWDNATPTGSSKSMKVTALVEAAAGDTFDFRMIQSIVANLTLGDARFTVQRLSGPSAIAASETVAARYEATGNRTPTSSKALNYDSRVFDTHGAVTTVVGDVAGWRFTAPIAGKYSVSISNYVSSATVGSLTVAKNGTIYAFMAQTNLTTGVIHSSALVDLNATDFIDIRSDGAPTCVNVVAKILAIQIHKVA